MFREFFHAGRHADAFCNTAFSCFSSSSSISFSGNIKVSVAMSTRALAIPGCVFAHSKDFGTSAIVDAPSTTLPISGSAKLPMM